MRTTALARFLLALFGPTLSAAELPTVELNRDVRPILADHCFACHGPDSGLGFAPLRLGVRFSNFGTTSITAAVGAGEAKAGVIPGVGHGGGGPIYGFSGAAPDAASEPSSGTRRAAG